MKIGIIVCVPNFVSGSYDLQMLKRVQHDKKGQLVHRLERVPDKNEARGSIPRLPTQFQSIFFFLIEIDPFLDYTIFMKSAFVTGGGKGLGKGFVEYLLDQDMLVFAGVRNPKDTRLTPHKNLRMIPLDVSQDTSIVQAAGIVAKEVDSLDYLINNAGVNKDTATNGHQELVSTMPMLDRKLLLTMFDINTVAPLLMAQQFLPLLRKTNSFIINISSCRASYHDEFENSSAKYGYRASKTALNMMTFCSVVDLPASVRTFAVHPGSVRTDMNPEGEDNPYEQARQIIEISTSKWKEDWNGKFLRYDGTLYPL